VISGKGPTSWGRVTAEEGAPAPDAVVELHNATDVLTQVAVDRDERYRST
jgi:hypothetical protein